MIELIAVTKEINNKVLLKDVNLKIENGEKVGIVGPVGSGKTTLLRTILSIYKNTSGQVIVRSKNIGYMPSSKGGYDELSIKDNIQAYSGIEIKVNKKLQDISKKVGVYDYLDKKGAELSSGMKQKASLLIVISDDPEILVLDEPTANLDIETRDKITKFLEDYTKDKTMIITSHNLSDIEELCDRVIFIEEGKLYINEDIDELKRKFSEKRVKIIFKENLKLKDIEVLKSKFIDEEVSENYILIDEEKNKINEVLAYAIDLNLEIFEVKRESKNLKEIYLDIREDDIKGEKAFK